MKTSARTGTVLSKLRRCVPLLMVALTNETLAQTSAAASEAVVFGIPHASEWVENRGQWERSSRFRGASRDVAVSLGDRDVTLCSSECVSEDTIRRNVVRLSFVTEPSAVGPVPSSVSCGPRHVIHGDDPSLWRSGLLAYESVSYRWLAHGIETVVAMSDGGLRLQIRVEPCADPRLVSFRLEGTDLVEAAPDGGLVIHMPTGTFRLKGPKAVVVEGTENRILPARFQEVGDRTYSLDLPVRDPARAIVIDTGLEWSTFLGGTGGEGIRVLDIGPDQTVTVAGVTNSLNFPTTPGAFDVTYAGGSGTSAADVFVARLDGSASRLLWATFLGGSINEEARGLIVDADGSVILAGHTTSPDYPTTSGVFMQSKPGIGSDGVITRLAADGSSLVYSTFLGGGSIDQILALDRDASHNVIVAGSTQSADFPLTAGAIQPGGGEPPGDAFAARLSPDGSRLEYSTTLGGTAADTALAVVAGHDGLVYVAGATNSSDYPTTPGAFDETYEGLGGHIVISCVDMDTGTLVASTYFGGDAVDVVADVGVDPRGLVVVTGYTEGLPTTADAFDTTYKGYEDAFVSKFDPGLQTLMYSTYVSGFRRDFAYAMEIEPSGAVVVAGNTDSQSFPATEGALQESKATSGHDRDLFVFRLAPDGQTLHYCTYLGGSQADGYQEMGLAVDGTGAAIIGAFAVSDDFPTTPGTYDPDKAPGTPSDAIVARLSLLPRGAEVFGDSTPGCSGPLAIGVSAMPKLGSTVFALTCSNVSPASVPGLLVVGLMPLASPLGAGGAALWIDPQAIVLVAPATTDDIGYAEVPVRIPADPLLAGQQAYVQFFWPTGCPRESLSASSGMALTLQP